MKSFKLGLACSVAPFLLLIKPALPLSSWVLFLIMLTLAALVNFWWSLTRPMPHWLSDE